MLYQCFSMMWGRNSYGNLLSIKLFIEIVLFSILEREAERCYAAIGEIVVVVPCLSAIIWRKNIVSSLSQMVGEFILISAVDNLFDAKRKITSSTVNEFSLIILRRSNLGVCNSSIFLGRVSSMRLELMHALKSLLLCSS